jgi:hypothetical protein
MIAAHEGGSQTRPYVFLGGLICRALSEAQINRFQGIGADGVFVRFTGNLKPKS